MTSRRILVLCSGSWFWCCVRPVLPHPDHRCHKISLCCHVSICLPQPKLVLMDESTSALDTRNERLLYQALRDAGA